MAPTTTSYPSEWQCRQKQRSLSSCKTSSSGHYTWICELFITVRLGSLYMKVSFGVVLNLAVLTLLGTSLINRFVSGIFCFESEEDPWHSHETTIYLISRKRKFCDATTSRSNTENDKLDIVGSMSIPVHKTRQNVLTLHKKHRVLVVVATFCIHIVEIRVFKKIMEKMCAACGAIDFLTFQCLHAWILNFSVNATQPPKVIMAVYGTELPQSYIHHLLYINHFALKPPIEWISPLSALSARLLKSHYCAQWKKKSK